MGARTKWRVGTLAVFKRQPVRSTLENEAITRPKALNPVFIAIPFDAFFQSTRRLDCAGEIPPGQQLPGRHYQDPLVPALGPKERPSPDRSGSQRSESPLEDRRGSSARCK